MFGALVALGGVEGERSDQFAAGFFEDPDVEVAGEHEDESGSAPSPEGAVVESADVEAAEIR